MRAESRHINLTYVITPATWMTDAQGHKVGATPGFRIVFGGLRSAFWDSESIKDPAQREIAENFLRNHPDNGVRYHIVDEPSSVKDNTVIDGRVSTVNATPAPVAMCVATVIEPGKESALCGKPAAEGAEFCTSHLKEMETV